MANVTLRGIRKTYGRGPTVIHGVDLDIRDGEFMVFVGPSGCGKSTLLRMIAGLEEISAGELRIGDRLVNGLEPSERGVSMVFQSYALYPHMTVYDNMAFGLRQARRKHDDIDRAVRHAAELLQVGPLLERKPAALSGGQRQRVAIGRSIVRESSVSLFDEPLSNLDASLRVQMRIELSRLHRRLGNTVVYVTHDQVEAMTLGDRIVVFNAGHIEQAGTPLDLYHRPANRFVAGFLGSPRMNFLPCLVQSFSQGVATLKWGAGGSLQMPAHSTLLAPGLALTLGVRPEHLRLSNDQGPPAQVELVEHLGDSTMCHVRMAGVDEPVAVRLDDGAPGPQAGDIVRLMPQVHACHLFGADGRSLPRPPLS
ncbi:ABC transporter ATP-binding protein [Piscinibacter terrae]|uniref:sn-glycerol-3-phosphate ABC transporter ATP-binding protein UgpC n=1 Tax=Piscinibacter terrae TaxID=2496871 RepID=A0A3N7HLK0_9BURK|nr:sn-glycerol-3-phosphate ABC transporter ATP-binding protein UgpC [Albitalea terrae]RQP23008.1 sn-glycerol-3-phosphate ABC transporter ATP-binding protein UgpC [Albitalea terrae]